MSNGPDKASVLALLDDLAEGRPPAATNPTPPPEAAPTPAARLDTAALTPAERQFLRSLIATPRALRNFLASADALAAARAQTGLEAFRTRMAARTDIEPGLRDALTRLVETFPASFARPDGQGIPMAEPFAPRHVEFWRWLFGLRRGYPQRAFIALWPRGGGKSTSVELALATVAQLRSRAYGLYVCGTQNQADTHVGNVGTLLGLIGVERALTQYGEARAWRRNRLIAEGFALDAIGLDVAVRGIKIDDARPDLIVLDDIDEQHDTPATIGKKIHTITHSILPAGSTALAVLGVQNLPNRGGVFAQLADGRADWLIERTVSGPYPAVDGLEVERDAQDGEPTRWRIVAGAPTWDGQILADCEYQINTFGLQAFLAESQHEGRRQGGMFRREWFEPPVAEFPYNADLIRFWDMAGRRNKPGRDPGDPDYAVGVLMGALNGQFWIVDVRRIRGTPFDVEQLIARTADRDTRRVPIYLEQEGGSAGEFVIDAFQRRVLPGYAVYPVKPILAKEIRAQPFASAAEAGNVYMVQGGWNREFLDEIEGVFGGGAAHDDQADAASGAHEVLAGGQYHRISRDDYRPVPGTQRRFDTRNYATAGDPTGRQLDRPPSKRRRAREGRW